jgi:hypothetical protein
VDPIDDLGVRGFFVMLRCATFTKFLFLKNQAETARKIVFPVA